MDTKETRDATGTPEGETVRPPLPRELFADGCSEPERRPLRFGDKWSAMVLRCLQDGPRRFTELRRPLYRVTPKVLTETLRAMERDGIVSRTAYDENPPRVEYALTPLGRSLVGPLDAACAWTREHGTDLRRARDAYDRAREGGA
ncbi:helix-turn-helix domain-containing protein [Streptomyces sp. NPDC020875]|uniref:winged helix-turn-helix transcriptional regulator n=1 Tax=Streptomyces sp. NPDC020875 TaxID=3154898 RepID=UPI00340AC12C